MFYQCYCCQQDIVTDFEETHYHLRMIKDCCGLEKIYLEITLCKDCFDLKLSEN